MGELAGDARIEVKGDTAWWVERSYAGHGRVEDGVFVTEYADLGQLTAWILRQDGRAKPLDPPELVDAVGSALARVAERHDGEPPVPAAPRKAENGLPPNERLGGPVPPERFAVLQALLAHLLAACGEGKRARIPAAELVDGFRIPYDQLDDHLQLLNLVNFGGGCYAVYAVLEGDEVRVEKELFGDAFRRPPRLTPLEARAIRLALEFVGPMIAAEANTPLERVRVKLEETFGQFEQRDTPEPAPIGEEERLIRVLAEAIESRRLVEIEYLKEQQTETTTRMIEPHRIERELPYWRVHAWDRGPDAVRTFRIDRMRSAKVLRERFQPRPEFEPESRKRHALAWVSPEGARWRVERGATPLADGAALQEISFGTDEWLIGEILSLRGEGVLLEPAKLRGRIATRARQLERSLTRTAAKRR
jgi:proteasome accessory factor C